MKNTSVCGTCLTGKTRLRPVKENLLIFYEKLTNIKFNSEDARPRALCCFCYQKLLRCHSFSEMAHRSEKILSNLYDRGLEATHEYITEVNLGMKQHLSVVTLPLISLDGNTTETDSQATTKDEPLLCIKEEVLTTEPDILEEVESFPEDYTKSEVTFDENNSDQGNDVRDSIFKINVEQTKSDYLKMPITIKEEKLIVIDIKEETTESNNLVEIEYVPQDCTKSELTLQTDKSNQWNLVEKLKNDENLLNVEQTKLKDLKRPFICDICNKIFYMKCKLVSHIINLHIQPKKQLTKQDTETNSMIEEKIDSQKKQFACNICDKKFNHKSSLVYHIGTHKRAKQFPCNVCSKQFDEISILENHMKIHNGEKPFACTVCDKQFNRKYSLVCHIRTHTGEKPFPCSVCGKQFIRKDILFLHMRTHTGEKAFACQVCDKQFNQKNNFVAHMRIHTGEKPFACQVCGKQFHIKGHLVEHSRTHSGEKPFGCNICDKQFSRKAHLVSHMRIHTDLKPFACQVCDKHYKRKEHLVEHVRSHTGEKPYTCNVCNKRFVTKGSQTKHMRIHTGEKRYACNVCDKQFIHKNSQVVHMRSHMTEDSS